MIFKNKEEEEKYIEEELIKLRNELVNEIELDMLSVEDIKKVIYIAFDQSLELTESYKTMILNILDKVITKNSIKIAKINSMNRGINGL